MLKNYLKIAFKVLGRRKFFTFVSLFGISFTFIVFAVAAAFFENAMDDSPPESQSDRMLYISRARFTNEEGRRSWSSSAGFKMLEDYARGLPHLENMTLYTRLQQVVSFANNSKMDLNLKFTDGHYFEVFDFPFLEGQAYFEDDVDASRSVAVINLATKTFLFGQDQAVGREFVVDGMRFTVLGVVPNIPEYRMDTYADIWVPHTHIKGENYREKYLGPFTGVLLAEDKRFFPVIQEAFQTEIKKVPALRPELTIFESAADTQMERLARSFYYGYGPGPNVTKLILQGLGLVLLFMLLPVVNLINLNLSRIMERASEIAIRKAFGATSRHLTQQFLVENLLLTTIGSVLGILGSIAVLKAISAMDYMNHAGYHLNLNILAAIFVVALIFGLLSGVYPAWRMSRLHVAQALKGEAS